METRGGNTRHTRQRSDITVLQGGGGGTLETPQDRHRDIHKTGPPERNRQTEAKVEQGAQEAKAGGPSWPWPRPSARPLQPGPLYPPPKKIHGQLRGIRSPPGLNTQKHS